MRKRALCILLMFILCLLPSCDGTEQYDAPKNISDMYFVYYSQKINTETGNVTPLCTDPLCSHTQEECQFYRIFAEGETGARYGNKLIYNGSYLIPNDDPSSPFPTVIQRAIFSYDLLTNTVTKHYDLPRSDKTNVISSFRYFDGHIFLKVILPPEGVKNPKADEYNIQTVIIDIDKNTQKSCPNITANGYVIIDYTGDEIYYFDNTYKYHVLDIDTGTDTVIDTEQLSEKAKQYELVYFKWNNVPEDEIGIWIKSADGSQKRIVPDAMHGVKVGDQIVYPMLNPKYDTEYSEVLYYYLDIWACNLDGSNQRRIFENPGNILIPYTFQHEAQAAGDHFGIPGFETVMNEDGKKEILHDPNNSNMSSFFILDTLTGEYKTVAVTKLGI